MDALSECLDVNVVGTKNLLEASTGAGVCRFIYSASSTCYGNSPTPHRLDTRIDLLNPYGWSKYAGEQLALMFALNNPIDVVSLRYFNVYGPREPVSGPYALVLGIFVGNWLAGRSLEIHGTGHQSRDFVHVSDVVSCNIRAAESSVSGRAFNVGTGRAVSVLELAGLISDDLAYAPPRKGDSKSTLADISETTEHLGWTPAVEIHTGVAEAVALAASSTNQIR